jgi:phage terminase large subunit-like protein
MHDPVKIRIQQRHFFMAKNSRPPKKSASIKPQETRTRRSAYLSTPAIRRNPDPATEYAEEILSGRKPAGRLVRLACQRHISDWTHRKELGLTLSEERIHRVMHFFGMLKHSKGEWAGRTVIPEDWERFILSSVFGWVREDHTRRYRVAYVSIGRKNGKSTLAAGIGNYLFLADREPGAEIVTASTKRDQSRITHSESIRMIQSSPEFKSIVTILKDNLSVPRQHSKYEPLGADADTLDGLNLSGIIGDEIHAWKGRSLWDVLETATGARRQPLMFGITTAGTDRNSLAYQLHDYSTKILEGTIQDDSFFAYIATLDAGDSWEDENVWIKSNPNLGVSVKLSTLREECERAKQMPSAVNAFRRLRMNEWTESHSQWLDMAAYDDGAIPVNPDELEGRECYAGLDLASTQDVTGLVLMFKDAAGAYDLLPFFWIPEESIATRTKRDRVLYDVWARDGFIFSTEGNVCDYDQIREFIRDLADRYKIQQIAYDRWNASQLVTQLQEDGATMVPVGMGFQSLSAPTKEFEKLILSRKIRHGGNPVLRWMMTNVSIKTDPAGNQKPDRSKSTEKIDGVIATLLALSRSIVTQEPTGSVYDNPDENPWI